MARSTLLSDLTCHIIDLPGLKWIISGNITLPSTPELSITFDIQISSTWMPMYNSITAAESKRPSTTARGIDEAIPPVWSALSKKLTQMPDSALEHVQRKWFGKDSTLTFTFTA